MDAPLDLILELYRAAKETPVDEFQELALALVKQQTSFRTAFWGSGEMTSSGLIAQSIHLHNEPPEMLKDWVRINRKDTVIDDVFSNPGHALISHTPSRYKAIGDGEILDYAKHYGHMSIMVVSTMSASHPAGQWLSLYRPDQHDHFTQAEGHLLEQLAPHLAEALEINRLLGQAHISEHGDPGTAGTRAIARSDGTLYHCGKKFTDLLLEIWPEWQCGRLPEELMVALHPGREIILSNHGIAVSASVLGNMLMLTIRRISPLHILSQRELEVARLYGAGNSYKEIGLLLDISPSTVRNFLGRIYTKLGIGNKMELASMLAKLCLLVECLAGDFFEHFQWPMLAANSILI